MNTCTHPESKREYMKLSHARGFHKCLVCQDCGKKLMGPNGMWFAKEAGDEALPEYDSSKWDDVRVAKIEQQRAERLEEWKQKHEEYEHYIFEDPMWQKRRALVLQRSKHICEACLERPATQVHHDNYKSLFCEILFHLHAVCASCHRKIHDMGNQP